MHAFRRSAILVPLVFCAICLSGLSVTAQVSAIYSDYGGYWTSNSSSLSATEPNNSHNLVGFTWNGTTFSTGVNDALLTTNGVSFTPLNFRAFPINAVPSSGGSSYYVMLGQLYDGINNGGDASTTSPFSSTLTGTELASFLTDGTRGLDLGTGFANIPSGSTLRFELSSSGIAASAINDGVPDVLITQMADPTSSKDILQFVDASGTVVGSTLSIDQSLTTIVGNWKADFYNLNSTPSGIMNVQKTVRLYAVDLSAFGITAANYADAVALVYKPGGTSDPAFLAFNEPSIGVATQLSIVTTPPNYYSSATLSPSPSVQIQDGSGQPVEQAGIPVTVSIASGSGTLGGTLTVNTDASGVATFDNLQITGTDDATLRFASSSLEAAVSSTIAAGALPLTWLDFTARQQGTGVLLNWSTAAESNTKDFQVLHSVDGSAWTVVGTVTAAGNSTTVQQYSLVDAAPAQGMNYYRILQRDLDNTGSYSKTVSLAYGAAAAGMRVYPNPVVDNVLNIRLDEATTVTLFSNDGKLIWRKQLAAGSHAISTQFLARGVYRLLTAAGSQTIVIQ